eukprot:CAMPEP_0185794434 /NCGR_PEP_ID=MMETSP1174-20130828/160013_1 /TAXON_ID=35687 /ORGANISM="Dictyocha speculum, Strain CCMP1381" /LENGTH=327 /DNA_ID=CAMNT_0028489665 /DNA_START=176 /DNA_END=1159 /DNA_ORIENTATION=-
MGGESSSRRAVFCASRYLGDTPTNKASVGNEELHGAVVEAARRVCYEMHVLQTGFFTVLLSAAANCYPLAMRPRRVLASFLGIVIYGEASSGIISLNDPRNTAIDLQVAEWLTALWDKPLFREACGIKYTDECRLLFDDAARFANPYYEPSVAEERAMQCFRQNFRGSDILQHVVCTNGGYHAFYDITQAQSNTESRKWIHHFDDVDLILFCASLPAFNQYSQLDPDQNLMAEAIEHFHWIASCVHFSRAHFHILFTKKDLFAVELRNVDIGSVDEWSDFQGASGSLEDGIEYFKSKFENGNWPRNLVNSKISASSMVAIDEHSVLV